MLAVSHITGFWWHESSRAERVEIIEAWYYESPEGTIGEGA